MIQLIRSLVARYTTWNVQHVTEARELEPRSGPSHTLGHHSMTAEAMKMDKISEGLGMEQVADSWSLGTRHCLGTRGVQEAAAREEEGMPESHCFC